MVTGGDIARRDLALYRTPLGVLYSWLHCRLHENGTACLTSQERARRIDAARAMLARARGL